MKPVRQLCMTTTITLAALASYAQPQEARKAQYTLKDLGTLGGSITAAGGISNKNWIEGYSLLPGDMASHAFLWHKGVMTDLGTLGGANSFSEFRPNSRGEVGGFAETPSSDPNGEDFCGFEDSVTCLPFFWHDGVMTAQPTLGGNNGAGFGTNDQGELAGMAENTIAEPTCAGSAQVFQYKPVIWRQGRVHELPTIGDDPVGVAYAVNEWGEAVGQTGPCGTESFDGTGHAVLWKSGKAIDLGSLGGTKNNAPQDLNNRGQVVGFSNLAGDATFHSFLWQKGLMTDLGTLPGDVHSVAESINSSGEVVGRSSDASFNGSGYVWKNGVMTDLNTLIPANSPLYILEGTSNNDRGQIVGIALELSTGDMHAFLATPNQCEDGESTATAVVSESAQRPKITLPERTRKLLEQPRRRHLLPQMF